MESQHLIELRAENFKRLTAVRIKLDPKSPSGVIILSGKNGAGKSSVLDAICAALCGERYAPVQPIRNGAEKSVVIVKTEDLVVTRTFTKSGGSLTVRDAEGRTHSSPQKLLDKLTSTLAFDPLGFSRLAPKQQAETLLRICPVKLDLAKNAAEAQIAYDERRDENRRLKECEAQLKNFESLEVVPEKEISVSELAAELARFQLLEKERGQKELRMAALEQNRKYLQSRIDDARMRLAEMEKQISEMFKERDDLAAKLEREGDNEEKIEELESRIANAEQENAKIRQGQSKKALTQKAAEIRAKIEAIEFRMKAKAQERQEALKAAKFPVDGLGLDDAGCVVFNGVPFSQASTSEQFRVGVALAAAANPELKLAFVRDGSLHDSASMRILSELAEAHELQILVERVEDNSPAAIQIVDGSNTDDDFA